MDRILFAVVTHENKFQGVRAGRAMIAVAYDGGFFSDVSGVSRSNGLMTARISAAA